MPRGPRKTTHEETEQTRGTILRTAEQLFMEHGYRAVSTRQIADACGLTQPALYHHFSDKQALYTEVLKENLAQTQAALERITRRNENLQETLRMIIRYLFSSTQHDLSLMFHDIKQELNPQIQETLNNAFQQGMIAPIASVFEQGLRCGALKSPEEGGVDPINAAYLFMSMLSRFLTRPHYPHDLYPQQNMLAVEAARAEIIVQILLYGLASPQKTDTIILQSSADDQ